ncbi:hypothetical protein ACFY4I_30885 [Streptomyces scabiei]|uniref:hypothetical protein n=1 Tax=Streptomyces scabiei TaxID=1930 RepID=UPI0036A9A1CB
MRPHLVVVALTGVREPHDDSALVTVTYSLATGVVPVFLGKPVQARRELSLRLDETRRRWR